MIDYDVSDGVCVLRLNNGPLNVISFELLDALVEAVARACADDAARAIVIIGHDDHFSAGADIKCLDAAAAPGEAVRMSRTYQDAFGAVEAASKPVVAAIAGKAMGSALELASACHYRVCDARTQFSMPEVNLGINPGAGGTQRLPRVMGPGPALRMLLTTRPIDAPAAKACGLVDAVCQRGELLDAARALLAKVEGPRPTSGRTDKTDDPAACEKAFAWAEKHLARVRPEIIAPSRITEALRTGLTESFAAGLLAEQRAFEECRATQATDNLIYTFFATRATSKAPDLEGVQAPALTRTAVVGMGSMGTGIAHALIIAGKPVVACDECPTALARGADRIRKSVQKRVDEGKMTPARAEAMLDLLTTSTDWSDLAGAEVVIEAVYEDVAIKQAVLGRIESICGEETIVATNTSTLSLDTLAASLTRPERLVGLHFFNPAHRMPLVEVIRRDATAPAVAATALRFAREIRKTPVLVRNREGFIVNRLFIPYLKEAFALLEEGAAARDIDEAMVAFGFPMGPLTLIDMAGIDILAATDAVLVDAFADHGPLSPVVAGLVEAGSLGQKTGCGVYRYERGDYTRYDSEATAAIVADVQRDAGVASRAVTSEEITDRLVLRMVGEAFCVFEEGIAQRESDIDVATVLGTGWPGFRGGVLRYARDTGPAAVVEKLDKLAATLGPRFEPCKMLRDLKGQG